MQPAARKVAPTLVATLFTLFANWIVWHQNYPVVVPDTNNQPPTPPTIPSDPPAEEREPPPRFTPPVCVLQPPESPPRFNDTHIRQRIDELASTLNGVVNLLQQPQSDPNIKLAAEVLAVIFSTLCLQWVGSCCNRRVDNSQEIKDALVQVSIQLGHLNQAIIRQDLEGGSARSNQKSHNSEAPKPSNEKMNIIYRFTPECERAMKAKVVKYLNEALKDSGATLEDYNKIDDRIRNVEQKRKEAASLLEETNNNCVWSFICFKPTPDTEATKIQNSVNGFPSGYTTMDGKFHQTYLTFEYCVRSTEKDQNGNLKHLLVDKDTFTTNIARLVRQAKGK